MTAEPDLAAIPATTRRVLDDLWSAGYAAYVVGGSLRDLVLGRAPKDWDVATSARPEQTLAVFPGAVYENAFGTVAVRPADRAIEVTTFRTDHDYADFRRPHRVEFGVEVEPDLARRDFTVNAMAWGADGDGAAPRLIDPHGGRDDLAARRLRAVGDPGARFREDALRMLRAVRLAATLGFEIEPATLEGIRANAPLAAHLSGERVAAELARLLAADRPSIGLRLAMDTGLLAAIAPDLAAQRGVPQAKIPGDDLWDHTCRTVDAADVARPTVRLAALLHDLGKPTTFADGHFLRHDEVGATMARAFLERLRMPRATTGEVVRLVRHHMFGYEPGWSDAAVRRFIRRTGRDILDDLLALRRADNVGSGRPPDHNLRDLPDRVAAQLAADVALDLAGLVVNGDDLMAELGIGPGPVVGRLLDRLLDRVIADPRLNDRAALLRFARADLEGGR